MLKYVALVPLLRGLLTLCSSDTNNIDTYALTYKVQGLSGEFQGEGL